MNKHRHRDWLATLGFWAVLAVLIVSTHHVTAAPVSLPLLTIDDFQYEGAFRLPADTFGASSLNYSQGPIAYNAAANSLYIVGHTHDQAIAEFAVPPLVSSDVITELNIASEPIQPFTQVINRATMGNAQNIDRIGGLAYVSAAETPFLLINGYEYYDADTDVTDSTLVARSVETLDSSVIDGFYAFDGGAGHTAGWMSPVPAEWQTAMGGRYITGKSSGIPIISRTSVGPSAFAFEPSNFDNPSQTAVSSVPSVPTEKLLDFSLDTPLHDDLDNAAGDNALWTHLSRAVYGFIVPQTRTYVTIGHSGGHSSGVCYKCVQDNGNLCGGYCPPDSNDLYHYYWLWDANDLVAVKNGDIEAHTVRPYEYGQFQTPFLSDELGGGSYDPDSGLLYVTIQKADREQGQYANPPVVVAYSFDVDDIDNVDDVDTGNSPLTVQPRAEVVQRDLYGALLLMLLVGFVLLFVSGRVIRGRSQ